MIPLKINFTDYEPSDFVRDAIEQKAQKLERYYDRIISCEVFVSTPHRSDRVQLHHIHVRVIVPGHELNVNREPEKNYAHKDVYVAIRDAFDAMYRQLEDYIRKRREVFQPQSGPPHGVVTKLFPENEYGFIQTFDGRELYFHKNSVLDDKFPDLAVGSEVRYSEELGAKGPQVTSMSMIGQHGHHGPT